MMGKASQGLEKLWPSMRLMSHPLTGPAAWVDHLYPGILAQQDPLALRLALASCASYPWADPRFPC